MHRKIEETPEREKMLIRLKELRLERGYSMTQAARKIFSHPDTYNRYEKGIREIPLDCLITLAKLYDCSLDISRVFPISRENTEGDVNGNSSLSDND